MQKTGARGAFQSGVPKPASDLERYPAMPKSPPLPHGQLHEHGYDSPIVELSVALASARDGRWHVSGSGVFIAPQLIVTARHVLEHHWAELEGGELRAEGEGHFNLFARHYHSTPEVGVVWMVSKFWVHPTSDLAVLYVESGDPVLRGYQWKIPRLQIVPPSVGTQVSAFGYRQSTISIAPNRADAVEWNEKPTTTHGLVVEVYAERRDSVMLNFPSFQTSSLFKAGMSGGPIFSDEGELIGLICSGIESLDPSEAISYGTSLWPLMGMQVQVRLEGDTEPKSYTIHDLASRSIVKVRNFNSVKVVREGGLIYTYFEKEIAG